MSYLFFDVETTGFFVGSDNRDERQPYTVQIAAVLADEKAKIKGSVNFIIETPGLKIPEKAIEIHGIADKDCKRYGVPLKTALLGLKKLSLKSTVMVAHNIDYDYRALQVSELRAFDKDSMLDNLEPFCTMRRTTEVCKLPKRGRQRGYKWPTLDELHNHLFGKSFKNQHDAMADVKAMMRCFYKLKRKGLIEIEIEIETKGLY